MKLKAAVAIDAWKLEIFKRRLTEAGYTCEQSKGLTADSLILYMEFEDGMALEKVVRAAQAEAAKSRAH